MNGIPKYSIAQKSGGSHEDDETPLYSLSIEREDETSETILRDATCQDAVDTAYRHAKFNGMTEYFQNGKLRKVRHEL